MIAVYSGVCKVNAAIATQVLIDVFQVNLTINAGTAGGMNQKVRLFDTAISERVIYHDIAEDILTDFHPWLESIYFQANPKLLVIAPKYSQTTEHSILFGTTLLHIKA